MAGEVGSKIVYSRELDIRYRADVLVAGAGPAGFAAAVMCARQKKKVLLVEQSGSVGGASVLAMVAEIMNFDDGKNFLSGGIGREIYDKMFETCAYERLTFNLRTEDLKRLYDEMLQEAGVQILFYNRITDAIVEGGTIKYVVLSGPEGNYAVSAQMYIDTTGNGSLCSFAGADYHYGDEDGMTMSATICSLWGGVDFKRKVRDGDAYEAAYADGVFSHYDPVLPGIKENYPEVNVGRGNVGHCFCVDDRSTESLTKAMITGRRMLMEYQRYYREYVAGCENAELLSSADFIGIRESRRIECEYTLSGENFFDQGAFPDEIGRYSYPVDIHPMTADFQGRDDFKKSISLRHEDGESYSIPYRCLVPKKIKNVLVAGRSIGADRTMQASARVIPCCYITGQAAGVAAAVCVENGTSAAEADVTEIRRRLRENGAYLKECL